jgi:hypothetical protein
LVIEHCARSHWQRAASGIYEGPVVKPASADFFERRYSLNILVAVGIGRSALVRPGLRLRGAALRSISSEPEAEGDRTIFLPPILRAGADVA